MRVVFSCPSCQGVVVANDVEQKPEISCNQCAWQKKTPTEKIIDEKPESCLICGCNDLWRQKDFPVAWGIGMVVIAVILSSIAIAYYRPVIAMAILMLFALLDMVLYLFMKDVLVCYRCASRHRSHPISKDDPAFNLEIAERYRQESLKEEKLLKNREAGET